MTGMSEDEADDFTEAEPVASASTDHKQITRAEREADIRKMMDEEGKVHP